VRSLAARVERQRLGALGIVGSTLLHASLVVAVVLATHRNEPRRLLPAYRVDLVAAPRAAGPAPASTATAPSPSVPTPPASRAVPPARRESPPVRTRAPATPLRPTPGVAKAPDAGATPAGAVPSPTASPGGAEGAVGGTGSDPATIRTEGVEFPFPGYLRNLVAQVFRRWQPPAGNANLEAEIFFLVHRDGTISGLTFVRRSGSFAFDLEAQGAVESAARGGTFGALPAGYGADVLPVSFYFSPRTLH